MTRPTLLSVNNYHYRRGGAEMVFLNQNRLFQAAGWEVLPFAMQHSKNLSTPMERYFVNEIEFGSGYSLSGKLSRAHKVIYSFEARAKLKALLEEHAPDICHIHNIYHHISPSILSLLKARSIPTVMTLHDFKLACPAYTMRTHDGVCERCKGHNYRHVIRNRCIKDSWLLSSIIYLETKLHTILNTYSENVSQFIAPSLFIREKMIDWGVSPQLLTYIPNSLPIEPYEPPEDVGRRFTYVGRLGPEKGLATFIRAAGRANVPARIVGVGPEEPALKELAHHHQSDVEFTGYLSGEALREAMRDARALVLPSEWYENAPISILEAYFEGVPVIGARIGGIPEMIEEGMTGLTFESGSESDLATKLSQMAAHPDTTIRSMGDAGRERLERHHTEGLYYERLRDLYARVGAAVPMTEQCTWN